MTYSKSQILHLGDGQKAIVTIPGWQSDAIWKNQKGASQNRLAKAYSASVWAYACITIRADAIASLPWQIDKGKSVLPDANPLVTLMREVNPELNWNDLVRALESDMLIYGQAYWLKVRGNNGGRPRGLMRLNPKTMKLKADSQGLQGFIQQLGSRREEYPREDVIYFREYNPDNDLLGLSKLAVALSSADAGVNAAEYTSAFFENYAIPPLVFSTDQPIDRSTLDRMVAWWRRRFQGAKNQHKTGFTTHGMKPNVIGYPTKDLALQEILEAMRQEICAVFRVPPTVVGAWEAANYATAETQQQALYQNAIKPHTEYFSGVLQAELFDEFERNLKMHWRFEDLDVLADDKKLEATRHAILVNSGIEDPDAAAEALGVEPATAPPPRQASNPGPLVPQVRSNGFDKELSQMQRFYTRRMKQGHSLDQDFKAEHIPESLKASIEGALAGVTELGQIGPIFDSAEQWRMYP